MNYLHRNLTPTLIARASKCLYSWYLECYGDPEEKKPLDAGTKLILQRGEEHEKKMMGTLGKVIEPDWDGKRWAEGIAATITLMKEGHPWIYQGVLADNKILGIPDFLHRVDGQSNLGNYTYIPIDAKNHKTVNKKDRFQLLTYTLLLEPILGIRASRGAIWLNTGEIEEVDLLRERVKFDELVSIMRKVQNGEYDESLRFRCGECATCPWVDYCQKNWSSMESTCLVRDVSAADAQKLYNIGIQSYKELAQKEPDYLSSFLGWKDEKTRKILLNAKAWASNDILLKVPVNFPEDGPIYLYDIETYGECTYLHGVIRLDGEERQERSFLARDLRQEKEAWHLFLNYLARDKKAVIYCWTDYERGFIDKLWNAYDGNPRGWELLDKNLKDQCAFVSKHFALPVVTYSIKEVAPFFGFHWTTKDAGGLNSEMWYKEWLETQDEQLLQKIVRYNLDDVTAMEVIHLELIKRFKSAFQTFPPR